MSQTQPIDATQTQQKKTEAMITKKNPTIKTNFENKANLTSKAGMVLVEKMARKTGLVRLIKKHFEGLRGDKQFDYLSIIYSMVMGLSLGGRGLSCTKVLKEDLALQKILGLKKVPSEATINRAMNDLAGKKHNKFDDAYELIDPGKIKDLFKDIIDNIKQYHRKMPEKQIFAAQKILDLFSDLLLEFGATLLNMSYRQDTYYKGFVPVFIDGTNLEVMGKYFEGALYDYNMNKSYSFETIWVGNFLIYQEFRNGGSYEASGMDKFIEKIDILKQKVKAFKRKPFLFLMDAAYGDEELFKALESGKHHYIIGANKMRKILDKGVSGLNREYWEYLGNDTKRGWSSVWVREFYHQAVGWEKPRRYIACKYIKEGEFIENHVFLWSNLEKEDLCELKQNKDTSLAHMIWKMYSYKQSKEVLFKSPLIDMNLHHPPSSYFATNQIFYSIASLATNLNYGISKILHKKERNMRFYRLREFYYRIPAIITTHANTVIVSFSKHMNLERQKLFQYALQRLEYI